MGKHSRRAYEAQHTPQLGDNPAASFFIERFPVDRTNEEISALVKKDIPSHLRDGLVIHNQLQQASASKNGAVELSWLNREAALLSASPEDRDASIRRRMLIEALASHTINYAFMEYTSEGGLMSDFSIVVRDDETPSSTYHELSGLFDEGDPLLETGEFEIQDRGEDARRVLDSTPLDRKLALDLLMGISERHFGNTPVPSFSELIYSLYEASPDRLKRTIGSNTNGEITVNAELEERTRRGRTRVTAYDVQVLQQLPQVTRPNEASALTFSLSQLSANSGAPYWQAKMGMTIMTKDPHFTPDDRESRFESLAQFYRDNPVEFFRAIAAAAERFAELDI